MQKPDAGNAKDALKKMLESAQPDPGTYRFRFNTPRIARAAVNAASLRSWTAPPARVPAIGLVSHCIALGRLHQALRSAERASLSAQFRRRPGLTPATEADAAVAARFLIRHAPGDAPTDQAGRALRLTHRADIPAGQKALIWAIRYGLALLPAAAGIQERNIS